MGSYPTHGTIAYGLLPHKWVGKKFVVRSDGRVGVCVGVTKSQPVERGGNSGSRRKSDAHGRPSSRHLWLEFADGTREHFDKYDLRRP